MGFGKQNTGVILRHSTEGAGLATLANSTALKISTPGGSDLTEDFRLLKTIGTISVAKKSVTPAAGEGPLLVGICSNELSVAEIAECLQAGGPKDRNDRLNEERATRPVWVYGTISLRETDNLSPYVEIEAKPRWTFSAPEGFSIFVYNMGDAALTTGMEVKFILTSYGVWIS